MRAPRDVPCLLATILTSIALSLAPVSIARADVYPRGWFPGAQPPRPREDWQRTRLAIGGGPGIPTSFPSEWKSALGWSIALLKPNQPWCDLALDAEGFVHHYDPAKLKVGGATNISAGTASFSDVALGVHLHPPRLGWRWYGVAQVALPDISRPAVFYTDASGSHTVEGVEIFGLDPGFVLGAGYERCVAGQLGGALEARWVVAPGSTEPAQMLTAFRANLSIPLPF